jgi:hypothetical protein
MTPYILLTLAALADIYTSRRIFKRGGYEANPIAAKLLGKRPSLAGMIAIKAAAAALVVYVGGPTGAYIAAAIWGVVALLNLRR